MPLAKEKKKKPCFPKLSQLSHSFQTKNVNKIPSQFNKHRFRSYFVVSMQRCLTLALTDVT